jgi:phytoene synthase
MEMAQTHMARWEQELLHLALEGSEHETMHHPSPVAEQGYVLAEQVTRENSKSFYLASALLPETKRRAVRVLYAFCRVTDDLVDKVNDNGAHPNAAVRQLAEWRARALAAPPADDILLKAWYGVRAHYRIPSTYVRQLIDGIGLDLTQRRYATFDGLAKYCYGVASTVGLMAMHIIGYHDRAAIPYAVKLGVALQLTNILRDIGEDFQQGRVYLPQEDLERFGYTEEDLARGVIDERFRNLIDFEIARAKQLYAEAWDGIRMLSPDGRLAIAAAADMYRGILDKIVANQYDVFHRRAHLGAVEKLARLPKLWWQVRALD